MFTPPTASDRALVREAREGATRSAAVGSLPVAVFAAVIAWVALGRERAMSEYVVPSLVTAAASALLFSASDLMSPLQVETP